MINNVDPENPVFKEIVVTFERSQTIALELRCICHDTQDTIAKSKDLLARAYALLERDCRGVITAEMKFENR